MKDLLYFEDYKIGDVRETGARTITETDIVIHAGQTGDFLPHHMDAEFADGRSAPASYRPPLANSAKPRS